VVVVGDDERAQGTVAIKHLGTGEQTAVPREAAAEFLKRARQGIED
jgi:histidyl-tRNA synthetase